MTSAGAASAPAAAVPAAGSTKSRAKADLLGTITVAATQSTAYGATAHLVIVPGVASIAESIAKAMNSA